MAYSAAGGANAPNVRETSIYIRPNTKPYIATNSTKGQSHNNVNENDESRKRKLKRGASNHIMIDKMRMSSAARSSK